MRRVFLLAMAFALGLFLFHLLGSPTEIRIVSGGGAGERSHAAVHSESTAQAVSGLGIGSDGVAGASHGEARKGAIESRELSRNGPSSGVDEEWADFPRGRRDILARLRYQSFDGTTTFDFDAKNLFRHRGFNPGDIYIDRGSRLELLQLIDGGLSEIRRVDKDMRSSFVSEGSEIVGSGRGIVLRPAPGVPPGSLPLGPDGYESDVPFDLLMPDNEGRVFGVRLKDMPSTGLLVEHSIYLRRELSATCVAWFSAKGLLDDRQVEAHLTRIFGDELFNARHFF